VLSHSKTVLIDEKGKTLQFDKKKKCFIDRNGKFIPNVDPPRNLDSKKSYQRYAEILLATNWCFEIFGLMRTSALKKTSKQESFYGTDKVLLAELSLIGRFEEVKESLFLRRCHSGQSTSISSPQKRESWNNPSAVRGFLYGRKMCFSGYLRAIFRYEEKLYSKTLCLVALSRWLLNLNSWKVLLKEYRRNLKSE
jgi:hypothetical protein